METIVNKSGHHYCIISDNYRKNGNTYVTIKFKETGTIRSVRRRVALMGEAKDPYAKDVYGIACKGNAPKIGNEKEYNLWRNMISRCYVEKDNHYNSYGKVGVTVHESWLCFERFLSDMKTLEGYDEVKYQQGLLELDKDKLCNEKGISPKIYSKETCMFMSRSENIALTRGKSKPKTLPETPLMSVEDIETGLVTMVYDIKNYAKRNNLSITSIYRRLNNETNKPYKGLIFKRENYYDETI